MLLQKKAKCKPAETDGYDVYANMICVQEKKNFNEEKNFASSAILPTPLQGMVRETFLADTGAIRTLHPNGRSASSFSRVSLEISTACVGASMRYDGVGEMKLYNKNGLLVPGRRTMRRRHGVCV